MDLTSSPDMIVRSTVTYVLLTYAVYVPSTARRTLLVAALMTVPLLGCIFIAFRSWDPALYDPPAATWPKGEVGRPDDGAPTEPVVTVADAITGTPLYMAPESIVSPNTVDASADLYALGAVGYWLLTGTHVFSGTGLVEVCAQHLHASPEPPSARLRAPVTADLEGLLLACLAKRPDDRPASALVLRERLLTCTAAGRWTNDRAAAWWGAHRDELALGKREPSAASTAVESRSLHLTVTRVAD